MQLKSRQAINDFLDDNDNETQGYIVFLEGKKDCLLIHNYKNLPKILKHIEMEDQKDNDEFNIFKD